MIRDLTAQDLDAWRAFLDGAPPRMREIVLTLLRNNAELKERNRRQRQLLDAERLHLAELERLVDAMGGTRTREA